MKPLVVVVMGVSGCGKSTIAGIVARQLGWDILEGDDLHPKANVDKMRQGTPLADDDRLPWLRAIADWIDERLGSGRPALVTCSSLRRAYRDILRGDSEPGRVAFAHLSGSRELLLQRMAARTGHFMPVSLLDSQLATLEQLGRDEAGIVVDIGEAPDDEAMQIVRRLQLA